MRKDNTDAQVSIRQLLDTRESSVGAQHQRIIRDEVNGLFAKDSFSPSLCAMNNNVMQLSQSSILTTSVKSPSPASQ